MPAHEKSKFCANLFLDILALSLLTTTTLAPQLSLAQNLRDADRQEALEQQERRAEQHARDPKVIKAHAVLYPSLSEEGLELFLKGTWLCNRNGYEGSDNGAPTEELRGLAFDKGVEYIKQAVKLNPKSPAVYLVLGGVLWEKYIRLSNAHQAEQSRLVRKEAGESYQKARELDPTNPDVYFGIARTASTSNLDEVIRNLRIVQKLNPEYPTVHSFLASTYEMMEDWENASEEYLKSFREPVGPVEVIDCLERVAQKSKQYSSLLNGYLVFLDVEPMRDNFDRVLFAASPNKPRAFRETSNLHLASLVDRKELAEFLVRVGEKAIQKQQAWLGSPLEQAYSRSTKKDASLATLKPPQDLSGMAQEFFKEALELDSSRLEEVRKIVEFSQLDELKKFGREISR
jgi:tetratricopeptide (TPR) repeat protein